MHTAVTPDAPDSAGILVGAAGIAAHDRRNKSIMNCFRDRTPSSTRSNSRGGLRYEQRANHNIQAEAVVYLKEPRARRNKLTLLKSASNRDLSLLMEESNTSTGNSTSSSTSASSDRTNCAANCNRHMIELKSRVAILEQDLYSERVYTKDLEVRIDELAKRVEELGELVQREKPKKSQSMRRGKAANNNVTVQPSKLVAWMNLSNLWSKRPSIETLRKQNIYNDEACFDTEIEMVLKHEVHKSVPKIVVDCCDIIEEQYLKSREPIEGIYRQCGDYNQIQSLRFKIDGNDYESLRQPKIEIHTLTGLLKLFLREIKSPLVSTNEAKTFIGKPNYWLLTELPAKIDILKRLIRTLPEENRDTMEFLFAHFHKLTRVPLRNVSAEALSLSVAPAIFHSIQDGVHMNDMHVLLKESEVLADCVKIMIEYHNRIFHS